MVDESNHKIDCVMSQSPPKTINWVHWTLWAATSSKVAQKIVIRKGRIFSHVNVVRSSEPSVAVKQKPATMNENTQVVRKSHRKKKPSTIYKEHFLW